MDGKKAYLNREILTGMDLLWYISLHLFIFMGNLIFLSICVAGFLDVAEI